VSLDELRKGLAIAALRGLDECFVFHSVGRKLDTGVN